MCIKIRENERKRYKTRKKRRVRCGREHKEEKSEKRRLIKRKKYIVKGRELQLCGGRS